MIITTAEIGNHNAPYWTPNLCNEMIMVDTEQEHQRFTHLRINTEQVTMTQLRIYASMLCLSSKQAYFDI